MNKMTREEYSQAANAYYTMLANGVEPNEAFVKAFPEGLPNQESVQEQAAKEQQSQVLPQVGGTLAGALGTKALIDGVSGSGWFAKEGGKEILKKGAEEVATDSAASPGFFSTLFGGSSTPAVASPEIVSATQGGTAAAATPGMFSGVMGNAGSMGVGPLAGIAAATYLGGKSAYDMFKGKSDNSLQGKAGRLTLGMATGGLSEIARPFAMHKSTRDVAKGHTKDLLKQSDDKQYQNYVSGMREQHNSAPVDPSKPFAGKYATEEEYIRNGLEAADLTGVYGNIKTFGPDWTKLNFDQQKKVTQGLIDAGLYNFRKGEVEVTDADRAKQIYASTLGMPGSKLNAALGSAKKLDTGIDKKKIAEALRR